MQVVVFGAGASGEKYFSKKGNEGQVVAVLDNDIQKQGAYFFGHKICPPSEIVNLCYDVIVIVMDTRSKYGKASIASVQTQLAELGVPPEKIAIYESRHTLLGMISELHVGFGYTIAQWLYDHDFCNISIYVEPQFEELIRAVTLPIKMNNGLTVNNYFSSSTQPFLLDYNWRGVFGQETYFPFDVHKINSSETMVYISPFIDTDIKQAVDDIGANFFAVNELVNYAFYYINGEEAILKLVAENPGVRAISYAYPDIELDKSDYAKNLMAKNITINSNIAALKNSDRDSEFLCAYIKEDVNASNEDWLEKVAFRPKTYYDENGFRILEDRVGKFVNIVSGRRATAFQPEIYDNTIYIFGGCSIFGIYCADDQTFPSQLQKILNINLPDGRIYKVENCGQFMFGQSVDLARVISSVKPQNGDILLYPGAPNKFSPFPFFNTSSLKLPDDYGYLYVDGPGHYSPNMQKFIAEKTFEFLVENNFFEGQPTVFKYKTRPIPICGLKWNLVSNNNVSAEFKGKLDECKANLRAIQAQIIGKIGCIVMNCNPFTLGHRYLIDYAAGKVKHLFIFVIEEDISVFSFKDRFEQVKVGTADLANVTILPSGPFIISALTFSDYFQKSSIQDRTIDPLRDVELFAKEIAPCLGITIRFAGEEPLDNITRQYNDAMKRILPQHGVEFEAIPRLESDGEVVSASRVRALLENKDFDAIAKLVPETTLHYLMPSCNQANQNNGQRIVA